MIKLTTKAFDMAGQENCDGPEFDMIQELAERVVKLEIALTHMLREVGDRVTDENFEESFEHTLFCAGWKDE